MQSIYDLVVSEKKISMREQEGTLLKASNLRVINERRPMESIYDLVVSEKAIPTDCETKNDRCGVFHRSHCNVSFKTEEDPTTVASRNCFS